MSHDVSDYDRVPDRADNPRSAPRQQIARGEPRRGFRLGWAGALALGWLAVVSPALGQDEAPGASATPVPFPEAPAIPSEAELRDQVVTREAFLERVDRYVMTVQQTSERYRGYVAQVKDLLAHCELRGATDRAQLEEDGFSSLVTEGERQCQQWARAFDQQARAYAARLDEAMVFQKALQRAGEEASRQLDRLRMMQQARRLKSEVDQSLQDVEAAGEAVEPWMD